ncbi:hypothetical protein VCR4J2_240067 [Vibrio coralliirubri]|nr:hypothetical protein VCR4J2_240067 [Vibrio coralliirubri]
MTMHENLEKQGFDYLIALNITVCLLEITYQTRQSLTFISKQANKGTHDVVSLQVLHLLFLECLMVSLLAYAASN